jgi:hypothetical protein
MVSLTGKDVEADDEDALAETFSKKSTSNVKKEPSQGPSDQGTGDFEVNDFHFDNAMSSQ